MTNSATSTEQMAGSEPLGLGPLRVKVPLQEISTKLEQAARRGRLPGHERAGAGKGGVICRVECPAMPFEGWMEIRGRRVEGGETELEFSTRLKRLWPWVFGAVLVLSIWPGVVLTEGLVASVIPGRAWEWTWWWYMPLTVPTAPWAMWVALKRSRAGVAVEAGLMRAKVAEILGESGGKVGVG